MGTNGTGYTRTGRRYLLLLVIALLVTGSGGCSLEPERLRQTREAQEQAKREVIPVLWTEPILAPPPGATELLRYEDLPSPVNGTSSVMLVYASPEPPGEVLRWYHDNHRTRYDISIPPFDSRGEASTVGESKVDDRVVVSVAVGPNPPDQLAASDRLKPAPPGTSTYITVGASQVK